MPLLLHRARGFAVSWIPIGRPVAVCSAGRRDAANKSRERSNFRPYVSGQRDLSTQLRSTSRSGSRGGGSDGLKKMDRYRGPRLPRPPSDPPDPHGYSPSSSPVDV